MEWFNYINDDKLKLAIPIGPRFQVNVPEWIGPPHKRYHHSEAMESSSSKWLGNVIWSTKNTTPKADKDLIGKGRPNSCSCPTPGSVLCVKRHVTEKRAHLERTLGTAFQKWKFDQMGEAVARLWNPSEEQKFTHLVKKFHHSEGKEFIKPALECFPLKSKKDIVNYYFNVYLPTRMSGCTLVDTDDEEEKSKSRVPKGSRKRARVDGVTSHKSKLVKTRYLAGRR